MNKTLYILILISIAIYSFSVGFYYAGKIQNEEINTSINLILPKSEHDLKKQLLFNTAQRSMLQELEKIQWFTKGEKK